MPIIATDIHYRLSGGGANSDPNLALGGVKSSVQMTAATLHNLFDLVSGAESATGDTEYRCMYVHNAHGTITLEGAKIWIETNTPATDTSAEISLGTSAVSATEQTIANENTAPTGTTFVPAAGEGAALTIGNLVAGASKAFWVKRIIGVAAAAFNNDSVIIRVKGDTSA